MRTIFRTLVLLSIVGCVVPAADSSGKWVYSLSGRGGASAARTTIDLKQDGSKVTGTLRSPTPDGKVTEFKISDGKVEGDLITFKVTRDLRGTSVVSEFKGTMEGDQLKLRIITQRPQGAVTQEAVASKCPPNCS